MNKTNNGLLLWILVHDPGAPGGSILLEFFSYADEDTVSDSTGDPNNSAPRSMISPPSVTLPLPEKHPFYELTITNVVVLTKSR